MLDDDVENFSELSGTVVIQHLYVQNVSDLHRLLITVI